MVCICPCLDLTVFTFILMFNVLYLDGKSACPCLSAFIGSDDTTVVGNYRKWSKLNICSCVTIY